MERGNVLKYTIYIAFVVIGGTFVFTNYQLVEKHSEVAQQSEASERALIDEKSLHQGEGRLSQTWTSDSTEFIEAQVSARVDYLYKSLTQETSSSSIRMRLSELGDFLRSLPSGQAVTVIEACLADREMDYDTRLNFVIGEKGRLDHPSSFRVALLDLLGQIDSVRAAAVAERVLSEYTHPDEWAICLRNYAWAHPEMAGRVYLRSKVEEMLEYSEWRDQPSIGFLEAFDVLVHAHSVESTATLANLIADESADEKAAGYAAFLVLDRLALADPAETFAEMRQHEALFENHGQMFAQIMARADVRDVNERAELMRYLLGPNRTVEELDAFSRVYPNVNFMISNNLLTQSAVLSQKEIEALDAASLAQIEQWLGDERFHPVRYHLSKIRDRLHPKNAGIQ